MEQNNSGAGKPKIDKEYLKKLADKIKAEKQKKANLSGQAPTGKPERPAKPVVPELLTDEDEEEMAAEKTAIIDLASLSGHAADARLVILDGKDQGKSLDITRDEVYCGRSLDSDFVISDISVSRKHFKVTHDGDHFSVHDTGSGNGIRVNGKKEPTIVLYHNDVITAGARNVRFEILNEDILANYSRQTEKVEEQVIIERKGSSSAMWIMVLLMLGVIGAGGYYFVVLMPQQQQQAVIPFKLGFEELDRVDELIEDQKLQKAEKLVASYLGKLKLEDIKEKAQLQTRQKKLAEERKIEKTIEEAKKLLAAGKTSEVDALLKPTSQESVFYKNVKALVGSDKVVEWRLAEVAVMMTQKNVNQAISTLTDLLVENPDNKKIRAMKDKIIGAVGAEKMEKIAQEVAKKKKIAKKKKDAKLAKRKKRIAAARKKAKRKKTARKKTARKKVAKKTPALTSMDIDEAVDLYASKSFNSAVKKLAKIAKKGDSKATRAKAKKMRVNVTKFKLLWKKANKAKGAKKKKLLQMCMKYDDKVSGGRLSGEIQDAMDSISSGGGGDFNPERAKKLYMEGRSKKASDPDAARDKLEQVLKLVPKSNKYYKKAKKLLKKL